MDVFIQGNDYISYCFHVYNMSIGMYMWKMQPETSYWLFVCKKRFNLHIARQTQLFLKVNSLSFGTMAEGCWESSSEEELFLTQSDLLLSGMNMMQHEGSDEKQESVCDIGFSALNAASME